MEKHEKQMASSNASNPSDFDQLVYVAGLTALCVRVRLRSARLRQRPSWQAAASVVSAASASPSPRSSLMDGLDSWTCPTAIVLLAGVHTLQLLQHMSQY
eukprot:g17537.t1